MFERRWQRVPVLLVTPAMAAAALGLVGCGSSPGHVSGAGVSGAGVSGAGVSGAGAAKSASKAKSASAVSRTVTFSAAKLRGALLTKINGVGAAAPAADGTYSALPGVTLKKPAGITVDPKTCADSSVAGFDAAEVASAPAASATFKVGGNGISEVLLSLSGTAAASALGKGVPAECASYKATAGGKTYHYAVKGSSIGGIGEQARAINVQTAGYPSDNVWTLLFRGAGFVGAVTIVGPDASEVAVRQLGTQAYGYAAKELS